MSLLSYNKLVELVNQGVINTPIEHINGSSIDITLDKTIMVEDMGVHIPIDLMAKQSLSMVETIIDNDGYILSNDEFILASSVETFNLPNNIAAEYKLKSSLARSGLEHLLAGWADPGWRNSKLTLELKNITQYHDLIIRPGMKIGQIVFWECDPVPDNANYANTGQYNNQNKVTGAKELK